jgi:RimJ/RimL family protein N-acetyltransferase
MTTPSRETPSDIIITALSTLNNLRHWWETRQADVDSAIAFTDDAPRNFVELLERIASGQYLFYLAQQDDTVVGAMWLHDVVYDPDGTPRAGWLGAYVLPEHRGQHMPQTMWLLVRKALMTLGVQSIYIATHHANTRAQIVVERHHGFHRVGTYPAFAYCQGVLTDYVILSMRQEDMAEAWALAHIRAKMQRIPPSPVTPQAPQHRLHDAEESESLGKKVVWQCSGVLDTM